jgi:hypothetical protein
MAQTIEWNVYTATEEEIAILWRLVQEALASSDLAQPEAEEAEVA